MDQDIKPSSAPAAQPQPVKPPASPGKIATGQTVDKQPIEQPQTAGQTEIADQISKKKSQAHMLIIVAALSILIAIAGLIVIFIGTGEGEEQPVTSALTTDEQLISHVNTLGLGVINFRNGDNNFEITSVKVSQLQSNNIPGEFNDPRTNEPYILTTSIPKIGELQYVIGGVCNADDSVSQSNDERNFAIRVLLENGTLYCLERAEVQQPGS